MTSKLKKKCIFAYSLRPFPSRYFSTTFISFSSFPCTGNYCLILDLTFDHGGFSSSFWILGEVSTPYVAHQCWCFLKPVTSLTPWLFPGSSLTLSAMRGSISVTCGSTLEFEVWRFFYHLEMEFMQFHLFSLLLHVFQKEKGWVLILNSKLWTCGNNMKQP